MEYQTWQTEWKTAPVWSKCSYALVQNQTLETLGSGWPLVWQVGFANDYETGANEWVIHMESVDIVGFPLI